MTPRARALWLERQVEPILRTVIEPLPDDWPDFRTVSALARHGLEVDEADDWRSLMGSHYTSAEAAGVVKRGRKPEGRKCG